MFLVLDKDKSQLIELFLKQEVLLFGDFTLKSGRQSPYFFNVGAICSGSSIGALGEAYARCIVSAGFDFATVFGPAYKGIPIAVATAHALAAAGHDVGWAFNRKEAKGHGEGGLFVGSPIEGRLVLVDDVLTAGTALREAAALVRGADAELAGVVVSMDRQEITDADSGRTAVQVLQTELGVGVKSLLTLQDVIDYLDSKSTQDNHLAALKAYKMEFCAP